MDICSFAVLRENTQSLSSNALFRMRTLFFFISISFLSFQGIAQYGHVDHW